ncbi:hypothetical protein H9L15_09390 [Sphingomonas daechungensis]|uniref:Uncharacterized protein n=1 Tax=Sphingomonas daechungensis TaxID=1176646 RepID=A0ABX6T188_9SPHN|nr:hypothetical protein H9L15_09390 [Sphingomonas daechungensis]
MPAGFGDDGDTFRPRRRLQQADRLRGNRNKVNTVAVLLSLAVHRPNDGEEVATSGSNVARIVGIIAAQRAFGLLNDTVGALDDAVERRA